jgi:hypothetical protein
MTLNIKNPSVEPPAIEVARRAWDGMIYEPQILTRFVALCTGKNFPSTDAACV